MSYIFLALSFRTRASARTAMSLRSKEKQLRLLREKLLLRPEGRDDVISAHACCKAVLQKCGIQRCTIFVWTMATACEGFFCEKEKPPAGWKEIDPAQLPSPKSWRWVLLMEPQEKRTLARQVDAAMGVVHDLIHENGALESDAPVRQLLTEVLFTLDNVDSSLRRYTASIAALDSWGRYRPRGAALWRPCIITGCVHIHSRGLQGKKSARQIGEQQQNASMVYIYILYII